MKLHYSVGIATKIIFMVTGIIVAAIGLVVVIATDLFQEESVTRVQEINTSSAGMLADQIRSTFDDVKEKMTIMAQYSTEAQNPSDAEKFFRTILQRSDTIVSFVAYQFDHEGRPVPKMAVFDEVTLAEYKIKSDDLKTRPVQWLLEGQKEAATSLAVVNISPLFQTPLLSVTFLSQKEKSEGANLVWGPDFLKGRWMFRADIRSEALLGGIGHRRQFNVFLVDGKGRLLVHSDPQWREAALKGNHLRDLPIVEKLTEGKLTNHQMEYVGLDGEAYLGSYKLVGVSGLGVVAEVPRQSAMAAIERVQYRSFWVMIAVVCLAFLVNFGFSKSLVRPLRELFDATSKIVDGQYDVKIQSQSSDEIGALSQAFSNMAEGLREREKIKTAFNKFHSKEVARKLLSGEIKLGGERKQVTIFFSDIRGFTSLSESMTPDQVVALLNEYMTEMVKIIEKWHGVVDKYIGDAIMAVWGVPETRPQDAYHAVRAALEMRDFLRGWNEQRLSQNKTTIEIGIGLHTGDVLAGNIGSESRLEYTVIGDSVNQASRIEGANKALSSDILISEATWALVKSQGIEAGPAIEIRAKGKSQNIVVRRVIGYKHEGVLQSSLSTEEIRRIHDEKLEIETVSEEKTQVAGKGSEVTRTEQDPMPARTAVSPGAPGAPAPGWGSGVASQMAAPMGYPYPMMMPPMMGMYPGMTVITRPAVPQAKPWFIIPSRDSSETHGPFQPEEVRLFLGQGLYDFEKALCFQEGDPAMKPLSAIPGVDRRTGPRTVQRPPVPALDEISVGGGPGPEPVGDEAEDVEVWYVSGPQGENLGPYSQSEMQAMLAQGSIGRTSFVWREGLTDWIQLHEVPGFNRRAAG